MRTETTARTRVVALLLALAGAAGLVFATSGLEPLRAAVLIFELEAILAALAGPLLAARLLEGGGGVVVGGGQALGFAAVVATSMAVRGAPDLASALLAQLVFLLEGVGLFALTLAVGSRRGVGTGLVAGLGAGVVLLGFPYLAGNVVAALPRGPEETVVAWLVVLCPAVATAGTFGGTDVFRNSALYDAFRPVQDVGCQYATPLQVLGAAAALALVLVALARVARRPALAGVAVALVLLALPSSGHAQDVFGSAPPAPDASIGPMQTKVRLGYLVPFLSGNFKVTGFTPDNLPTRLDLKSDLDLKLAYAIPTFEVEIGWQGAGRIWADYWEADWKGSFLSPGSAPVTFRNIVVPVNEVGTIDYGFRTVGVHGALDIPVLDFITLQLIGTARYVHYETHVKEPRSGIRDRNNVDAFAPGLGPGVDMFVTDMVYIYGSVQWLDISLGTIHGPVLHYREAHAGVRLEIVEHAMIGVEFYYLEVDVNDVYHSYRQRMLGPRVWVGVQF